MSETTEAPAYPDVRRGDVVETLHGVEVADPYRWLEDLDSPATAAFVEAQNAVTQAHLAGIPQRAAIRKRIEDLWDHERYDVPYRRGGKTFYRHNDGLQDQSVLYVVDHDGAEPRALIDPNKLSEDGTVALGQVSPSPDGALVAYAVQIAGSDWIEWRVREVATGADRADRVEWAKFSGAAWARDGSGFYYSCYDQPAEGEEYESKNEKQRMQFHALGTDPNGDRVVLQDPEHPKRGFGARVSEDGAFLVIYVWEGTARENRIHYVDLDDGREGELVRLLDENDASYDVVANVGRRFIVRTDLDAERGRVLAIDLDRPARDQWVELIPHADETLRNVSRVGDHLVCEYLQDARSLVRVHGLDGSHVRDVPLPGLGTATGFGGHVGDDVTHYAYSSFTTPTEIHRYDVVTGESTLFRRVELPFERTAFETEQVFYNSKDGTRILMFLTHKKGLVLDGNNPTYLYGYGGFNIPLTPGFAISNLVWLEMGGVHAVANLRGGGEYGEEWHAAGTLERKQNVFDDFIAAAEWLIAEKYTSTPKLAIAGGSNGGLLVGACMTQRPDLFGACIPAVGVLDMLRFHKFTIGWAWVSDYGSPDEPDAFAYIREYSPYHNLEEGASYPPTMVMTGDHDDRVVPSHSFKFAAALQRAQGGDAPCLIRIETRAGHGAGKPVSKQIDEVADKWAFVANELDVPYDGEN